MSGAADHWTVALDRIDAQLDAISLSLTTGDLGRLPDMAIPLGLPTLPPICVDRARALLDRHRDLEVQVLRRLEASAPPAATRRPAPLAAASAGRTPRFDALG